MGAIRLILIFRIVRSATQGARHEMEPGVEVGASRGIGAQNSAALHIPRCAPEMADAPNHRQVAF
jgi:hypothetical protein